MLRSQLGSLARTRTGPNTTPFTAAPPCATRPLSSQSFIPFAYVEAFRLLNSRIDLDKHVGAAGLLELNRDLQGSRAIRLLATTNLSLYDTLMDRHLSDGAVPETELVVRLERDLS